MTEHKTDYIGVFLQHDDGGWWIVDDNGGERHFDRQPTEADVRNYVTDIIGSH